MRLLSSIPVFYFTYNSHKQATLILIAFAILTDFADGYTARKYDAYSRIGRILDPLADKFFFIALAIGLLLSRQMPIWFFILAAGRDIAILLLGLLLKSRNGEIPEADIFGKFYYAALLVVILLILLDFSPAEKAGFQVLVTGWFVSVISYIIKFTHIINQDNAKNG